MNYRRLLPSLAHQKTTQLSLEVLSAPWRCSNLKRTRFRIWRGRNIWSWGMASLPQWCNSKRRTNSRYRWRKNSRPCHQCRQGRIWFSFSVSFPCTISFSLPYPRTWASPQKWQPWQRTIFFSLRIVYSVYKRYLDSPEKCHFGRRVAIHKLVIGKDDIH